MGNKKLLVNQVVIGYWVVSAVAVLLYFSLVLRVAMFASERTGGELIAIWFIGALVFGLVTWPFVLGVGWRVRRAYLRRTAEGVEGVVIDAGYRVTQTSNNPLSTHRVRVEVRFTHPETGVEHEMKKEFAFNEFRRGTAKAMKERFPVGAGMPMLVRGRAAGFDVPQRPQWVDIW
ncbi:hypothetical protein ACFXK0_25435 [Nocardia sp. NPDC059177]|uniref:hypothetical protein n=1 Tax=Nocardia sp. NPDC059177 TaxID=3346759 RepID=UPI00368BF510